MSENVRPWLKTNDVLLTFISKDVGPTSSALTTALAAFAAVIPAAT